ncbi:MAG: hypothetical protein AB7R00_01610, partial [Kofleriaceae bacterium]
MQHDARLAGVFVTLATSLFGCGASPEVPGDPNDGSSQEPGQDQDPTSDECSEDGQLIYVISLEDQTLATFDPRTKTFESKGVLSCPDDTNPYSLTIDRNGMAWVIYSSGSCIRWTSTRWP